VIAASASPKSVVCLLFKYRHKVGLDVAVEALRESIRSGKVKPGQIDPFAQICRVREVMRPYLEALVG